MYREDDNTPFYLRESPITDCIGLGKRIISVVDCAEFLDKTLYSDSASLHPGA